MIKISDRIKNGEILVSDGAWGTLLQEKGLKAGECPEKWNIDHNETVYEIAKSYIDAGADMIETNSFGGSRFKLSHFDLAEKAAEINEKAARISRQAAGPNKHVLGSIGPTGKILMMGDVTEEELYEAFKEQAVALEKGDADTILIETMSDIDEARIAIEAAKENTKCEIICTMTFERTVDGLYKTMMGIPPSALSQIAGKVDVIGANCGNGIEQMLPIVEEIKKELPEKPVLIQANAGLPIFEDGKTLFKETPEEMAAFVKKLVDAGANCIGGCCGTTPAHIRKIAEVVKEIMK